MNTYNPYKLFCGSFIPNWLMERSEISAGAKLCFARLTQFAGRDGKCYPKLETLAQSLGVKVRTINKYVSTLKNFKLIKVCRCGPHSPNQYLFLEHPWMTAPDIDMHERAPLDMHERACLYKENNIKKENIYKRKIKMQWVPLQNKELKEQAVDVLQYLNEKTVSCFRLNDRNLSYIMYHLKEKVSVNTCKAIIDMKTKEWLHTDMNKYLRPSTLFRPCNFEKYYGKHLNNPSKLASTPIVSKKDSHHVYSKYEIDKRFPLNDNISQHCKKYNLLQREGIQAEVRDGFAIIQ